MSSTQRPHESCHRPLTSEMLYETGGIPLAVASAPGAAGVRVWQITSRRGEPRTGRPPPRVLESPTLLDGGGVPTKDAVQGVPGGGRSESLCGRYAHGSGPGRRSE